MFFTATKVPLHPYRHDRCVDIQLGKSEALHLVGGNGSGKTTVLKALAGRVMSPFLSVNLTRTCLIRDRSVRLEGLNVRQQLMYYQCLYQKRSMEAESWLEDIVHKEMSSLSHGQARRVYLAQLYFTDALVWLLDEPVLGLDESHIQQLTHILSQHLNEGGSVVYASHQPLMIEGSARCMQLPA